MGHFIRKKMFSVLYLWPKETEKTLNLIDTISSKSNNPGSNPGDNIFLSVLN